MNVLGVAVLAFATACVSLGFSLDPTPATDPNAAPPNEKWDEAVRPAGFISKTIEVAGVSYKYVVYSPREYHPQSRQRRWPTIVFLHGSGECGTDGLRQLDIGLPPAIKKDHDRWPFLVICPQKPDREKQWESYDAVVMAMLEAAKKEYPVDQEHTYLTGLSQGGHGTWTIGANHPDVFAAIVPVCGYTSTHKGGADPASLAEKLRPVSVWAFHGEKDDIVLPIDMRQMVDALKAAKPDHEPKMTIYPDANHNSWDKAYAEQSLPGWLLEQSRPSR